MTKSLGLAWLNDAGSCPSRWPPIIGGAAGGLAGQHQALLVWSVAVPHWGLRIDCLNVLISRHLASQDRRQEREQSGRNPFSCRVFLGNAIKSFLAYFVRHTNWCNTNRSEPWEAGFLEATLELAAIFP